MSTRVLANWFGVYKKSDSLHRERLVQYIHLFESSWRDLSQTQATEALRKGPEGECQQALSLIETGLKRLSKAILRVTSESVVAALKQRLSSAQAQWQAVFEKE